VVIPVNVRTADDHQPPGQSTQGVYELLGLAFGKENHVEDNFRIEPPKAFAQIGEAIAVAKHVLHATRQDGIRLATMLNCDRMVQTRELPNDVPPDEAGCADGENSHPQARRSNVRTSASAETRPISRRLVYKPLRLVAGPVGPQVTASGHGPDQPEPGDSG